MDMQVSLIMDHWAVNSKRMSRMPGGSSLSLAGKMLWELIVVLSIIRRHGNRVVSFL